jgi:hypothetical protein
MKGNLDKLDVVLHRQFRQKTKRLILTLQGTGGAGYALYASDPFETERMEIIKQPELPNARLGQRTRTRVQYTMLNAFAVLRMVEFPISGVTVGYELGTAMGATKGGISTFYPRTQNFTRNAPGAGLILGPDTFGAPAFTSRVEISAPSMVEPYAVADYMFVSAQFAVEILLADLPAPPPARLNVVADWEVRMTAAGLQLPPR